MKAEIKWLDNPEIFRINQLDAHSDHNYYLNYKDLESGDNKLTQSLNGQWDFRFSINVMERPADFCKTDYDRSGFDKIMVISIHSTLGRVKGILDLLTVLRVLVQEKECSAKHSIIR